jgi:hypothetical protein
MKSAYNALSSEVMKIRQDTQGVSSIKELIFARCLLDWKRACVCVCVSLHMLHWKGAHAPTLQYVW